MYTYYRTHSEKRDYLRMVMNCPVEYTAEDDDQNYQGTCVNLSAKGLLISTDRHFPVGTRLTVHVRPNLIESPGFNAKVEVVRVEQPADSRMFGLGARVIEIIK